MKLVIFTIVVVITSNLIRKISLNMLCSVPCCKVQQIFFLAFHGKAFSYQNFEYKEVSYGSVNNHCGNNLEPYSKDISEYAVLCPLL